MSNEEKMKKMLEMLLSGGGEKMAQKMMIMEATHDIRHGIDGLYEITRGIVEYLTMPKTCNDADGKPLKVGDVLYCHDGSEKTVLGIGYKYAELSDTGNPKELDGIWYQPAIIAHRFSLSKEYAMQGNGEEKHFLEG